jgi:hypothetical protein
MAILLVCSAFFAFVVNLFTSLQAHTRVHQLRFFASPVHGSSLCHIRERFGQSLVIPSQFRSIARSSLVNIQ